MPVKLFRTAAWIALLLIFPLSIGCNRTSLMAEPAEQSVAAAITPQPAGEEAMKFSLKTAAQDGRLIYIGVGGQIDRQINPDLAVFAGDTVTITLINGDGMQHDISLPDFGATSSPVYSLGDQTELTFTVKDDQPGSFVYFCTVPGHRQLGQEGKFIVKER